ncbi:MAG: serine/threonine-protein kinase, partial [Rhodothermaceae bacterium]|nr:serine/threonine-protein kinase [Rhodothermaceae bacterium]
QWNRVQQLFKEVIDLDPDTRIFRMRQIKTEDTDLFNELSSLLAADSQETSLLDGFAIDQVDLSELVPMEGIRVGPFQIERQVGTGGMGNVYLARRFTGGFEQTVALKLIKYGMGSDHAVRRFEAERSILARLQHPHIARLIDGGLTPEGRPWFAMDYVEGEDIISWCRRLQLPAEKRLGLFLDVIDAVLFAHKNLVVHRDLKPGNIMVAGDDDDPRVKLLDFGIAGILEESDAEQAGVKAMTRAYASPEQIDGQAASTATSTDIYSLGVVMHQLLSGCHPDEEFRSENCRPETVNRELLAISGKAMQADPAGRFESVSEMGDEIRAWLVKRPVTCYSAGSGYRFRKLIVRNLAASTIAVFSVVAMVILVLVYTQELKAEKDRAEEESQRTYRIAQVLGSSLRSIDPMENGGQELTARGMVDRSTSYINYQLAGDPRTRSELLIMMAEIYANLIVFDVADSISMVAEQLMRETQDTTSFAYINMLADRSIILDKAGRYDDGLAMIRRAVDLANRHLRPGTLEFASVHLDYTYHLDANQEYALADSILMLVQPVYESNRETALTEYADFIFYLGTNYRRLGDYDKAEKYLFESLEISRGMYTGNHEQIASTMNHLSSLYQNKGEYDEALPWAQDSHRMRLAIFGPSHLNTIAAHANTARTYAGAGRLQEAAETYREVIAIFREEYSNDNFYISGLLQSYGGVYLRMKDFAGAETVIRESLEHSERLLPAGHIRQAYPLKGLADALRGQARYTEALDYAERAFQIRSEALPANNPDLMSSRHTLGICLWHLGRQDEARPHLQQALTFFETNPDRFRSQIEEINALGL